MTRLVKLSLIGVLSCLVVAMSLGVRANDATFVRDGSTSSVVSGPMIRVPQSPLAWLLSIRAENQTSTNWAGYAAAPDLSNSVDDSVSDVSSAWVVPTVTGGFRSAYSSDWVGIDGFIGDSVEQIGTDEDWVGGSAVYSAWWELYPAAEQSIPMSVHPGDVMAARVRWVSGNTFSLSLTDRTTGDSFTTQQTSRSTAARNSAEWIHEAPASIRGRVLPLAQTTPVTFSECKVTINGTSGPIGSASWHNVGLDMVQSGVTLAQAFALSADGSSFVVGPPGTAPHVRSSSASLAFTYTLGAAKPSAKSITFTNTGGGALSWSAAADSAWISCTPTSGPSGAFTSVSVDTASLAVGSYGGHIIVTSAGADNTPLTIPVALRIVRPPGKVTIIGPSSVAAAKAFKMNGTVSPAKGAVRVRRYISSKGVWKSEGSYLAVVSGRSWQAIVRTTAKGRWRFVAQFAGDSRHAPASAARVVNAR